MKKNNSSTFSFFFTFLKWIKKNIFLFKKQNRFFSKKYPNVLQFIQLTFLYFFALTSLLYSVLTILGHFPDIFLMVIPSFIQDIVKSPIFRLLLAPEKTYVIYLLVIEFIIFRSLFNFSKLFKYNVLLIFLLEMIQNLLVSYWDLFFNRSYGNETPSIDIQFAIVVISMIYFVFLLCYVYSYICSIKGKFASIPYMDWLTDSISFWLQIKTPRMGSGGYGDSKNSKKK
jgi:hypothetical protein